MDIFPSTHPPFLYLLFHPFRTLQRYVLDPASIIFYFLFQYIISSLFTPLEPPKDVIETGIGSNGGGGKKRKFRGRIAVIGAGLTGVTSAAHFISHGFDVVIFEASSGPDRAQYQTTKSASPSSKVSRGGLGGIWANVNSTSTLQFNSSLYRFHPSVLWSNAYPKRDEILAQIEKVWKKYGLDKKTVWETEVTEVRRVEDVKEDGTEADKTRPTHSKWLINPPRSFANAATDHVTSLPQHLQGPYDAVCVCIGTCAKPKMPISSDSMPGLKDRFQGKVLHSSELDTLSQGELETFKTGEESQNGEGKGFRRKKVVIIGAGASAVEAADTATARWETEGALSSNLLYKTQKDRLPSFLPSPFLKALLVSQNKRRSPVITHTTSSNKQRKRAQASIIVLARDDKWILPRNLLVNTVIALQPFGRQTPLSFIPEYLIRTFHYRSLAHLSPPLHSKGGLGLFEGTPIANNSFLDGIRKGEIEYFRGDVKLFKERSVVLNHRVRGSKPGQVGFEELELAADVVVMATGFEKPKISFLPKDIFPEGPSGPYAPPCLYMQNFSVTDWSILSTNSSYKDGIATAGHVHIGLYARILMVLLMDEKTRPSSAEMMLWVDVLRWLKTSDPKGNRGGLNFFTYCEMCLWLLGFHLFRFARLKWFFFVLFGWGIHWPDEFEDDDDDVARSLKTPKVEMNATRSFGGDNGSVTSLSSLC